MEMLNTRKRNFIEWERKLPAKVGKDYVRALANQDKKTLRAIEEKHGFKDIEERI